MEAASDESAAELVGAEVKWEGAIIRAGVERFRYADGTEVTREKVWHPGAVGILAVDDEHVWLTRQPREVIGDPASLEIPAGKLDVPGEPPLETAKRELAEEIGKRAEHWEELLAFYTSPGFSDERVWLYLATGPVGRPEAPSRRGRADRDRALAARAARRGDRAVRGLEVADRAAVAGGPGPDEHPPRGRARLRAGSRRLRARPSRLPARGVEWLVEQLELGPGRTVLDVGAGTGKLTRELVGSGATVVAVEPVPAMRAVLERVVPEARALEGTAEALPVDDGGVDAIVVAQAFHWFDGPAALAEFHRVLALGGRFALIWNRRRLEQPLHRAINEIIEPYRRDTPSHYRGEWRESLTASGLFSPIAELEVPIEQVLDADALVDRVGSISYIAALPDDEREAVIGRVRALSADGGDAPLRLGYTTEAYVYERT